MNVTNELNDLQVNLNIAERLVATAKRHITEYFMPVIKIIDPSYDTVTADIVSFEEAPGQHIKVVTIWSNCAGTHHETLLINKSLFETEDREQAARDFVSDQEAFFKSLGGLFPRPS